MREPLTLWRPEVTLTVWIVPLAAVTVTPWLGFTLCPPPGLMCSSAAAAAAEALAALCRAAGVPGAGELEQAAISRPATPVTAVIASQRAAPAVLP